MMETAFPRTFDTDPCFGLERSWEQKKSSYRSSAKFFFLIYFAVEYVHYEVHSISPNAHHESRTFILRQVGNYVTFRTDAR